MKHSKRWSAGILATVVAATCLATLPAPMTYASVDYVANGFEINYDGWTNRGALTSVEACPAAAHDSDRGMLVSNRLTKDDGAYSEKGLYLAGGQTYDYSVWVRHDEAADETFNLSLRYLCEETDTYTTVPLDVQSVAGGEWTELSASFAAPAETINLTMILTTDSTADFCFDDVSVKGQKAISTDKASAAEVGLKDIYANYFRFGTCMPGQSINDSTITGIVLREFNSVTCENEMKPDSTLNQGACSGTNVGVSLSSASRILDFCIQNNIAVRGHTFVWYSQTPDWFFKQNYQGGGADVTPDVMNQRLESYIKNMFAAIEKQYPQLNLYAYDVCNELFVNDGGGMRPGSNSAWTRVYGNDSFVLNAFAYARKYAPANCKLFINDYNEYMPAKTTDIYNMAMKVKAEGNIDGIGMQSHLSISYPSASVYRTAIDKFLSTGLDVQVTELDITNTDAKKYKDIVETILDADKESGKITALVVWGTTDATSWRGGDKPLLFDGNGQKKDCYDAVAAIVPESEYGDGDNPNDGGSPPTPPVPVEPDENGYFFHSTFEEGTDDWENRGENTVATSSTYAYAGSKSLKVSGRTEAWNGAGQSLSTRAFKPGGTYSFSGMVYQDASASEDISLTLQYDLDGETNYDQVASGTAEKGAWTLIENTSYAIPAGATGLLLYFETPENLIDFYVDEAVGGIEGAKNGGSSQGGKGKLGDVNGSGKVDVADATDLQDFLLHRAVTIDGASADMNKDGKLNGYDLQLLKALLLSGNANPVTTTTAPRVTTQAPTTTTTTKQLAAGQWNNMADISGVDKSKPMVAFTFDDGPVGTASSATSIRIQDALSKNGVHATFFYWGNKINGSNEAEIKRAQSLGMEIGNHTYTHSDLSKMSADQIKNEISQTNSILNRLTGLNDFLVRPPYLAVNTTVSSAAGVPLINCGVDSQDWNGASSSSIINTITSGMSNGSLKNKIVLMHETYTATAEAIEYLAPYMKQQGWQIVSVSELFKANGKDMWAGQVYNQLQ